MTSDSWFIFTLLELNSEFLMEEFVIWPCLPSFLMSRKHISAISVVNDSAKCGVKLSADYLEAARSEKHFQNILQTVEADRKNLPNLRKRKAPE